MAQQHRDVESVWDYPRPPAVRTTRCRVEVLLGGVMIARADEVVEVLETSHPPTVYLHRSAFADGCVIEADGTSWCEFKGRARYVDLVGGARRARRAGWYYPDPTPGYEALSERIAVYPAPMDRCRLDDEVVEAQAGDFYGGWITSRITGPFKGARGTHGW
ncbi:DUF427 domain-containing protein [Flexivirga lutea]